MFWTFVYISIIGTITYVVNMYNVQFFENSTQGIYILGLVSWKLIKAKDEL